MATTTLIAPHSVPPTVLRISYAPQPTVKTPDELWCEALRSGEFAKEECALRTVNGSCALGVLCEVYQRFVGGLAIRTAWGSCDVGLLVTYDGEEAMAPEKVRKWAGLSIKNAQKISRFSDRPRCDFNDVADLIETNRKKIFHKNV